ncbi:hypothetical protein [Thiorhodospira sibirica]|uniref:hypothetical protein n=1 Tax=Thiorhodospira sibirica TaxID=154347 RepID=UPI00022C286F|nr:hypothetical protein [Thiorhodospira sibirica]
MILYLVVLTLLSLLLLGLVRLVLRRPGSHHNTLILIGLSCLYLVLVFQLSHFFAASLQ